MKGVNPLIHLVPARRLSADAMRREGKTYTKSIKKSQNYLEIEKGESNLSDILFPPERFRNNDDINEEDSCNKSIAPEDWDCIPQGSYDNKQHRKINYQVTLTNNKAELLKDFSCGTKSASKSINIQGENSMDRAKFYECIRRKPFNGKLMQKQVEGMEVILTEWEKRDLDDTRCLAYILATAYHETAHTMLPIAEYGKGRGRRYGKADRSTGKTYYGRGYVQITWKDNYKRFSDHLDIDLVNHTEKAMDANIATKIIFDGMFKGMFTSRKLSHYFRAESDWFNARRIVNGLDKAERIGRYGRQFWYAILMANGEIDKARAAPKSVNSTEPQGDIGNEEFSEITELDREFGV